MDFLVDNWLWLVAAIVSGLGLLWPSLNGTSQGLSPNEAVQLINRNKPVVLDVRTEEEIASGRIVGTKQLDMANNWEQSSALPKDKEKPVLLVCQTGARAQRAAAQLVKAGYSQTKVLAGGIAAWTAANLPLETAKTQSISAKGPKNNKA